jgi:hypothetical protein
VLAQLAIAHASVAKPLLGFQYVSALSPLGRMQEAREKGTPEAGLVSIQHASERDAPNAIVS